MPKALHDALVRRANQKGLTGDRKDAFVFGTMNRIKKGDSPPRRKHTGKRRGLLR